MLSLAPRSIRLLYTRSFVTLALARGAATLARRQVDPSRPSTWEFCAFSQNGEDGVIDFLCDHLVGPNRYFVEIGAEAGRENNSSWLAIARRYAGLAVEANRASASRLRDMATMALGVEVLELQVAPENVGEVRQRALYSRPDVMSVDIDGNDYYIVVALLATGLRPKIVCVEYNSAFGPTAAVTIPYRRWGERPAHPLHYGVSVAGWRVALETKGYQFIGVDMNGVNAFFVDPLTLDPGIAPALRLENPFRENFLQLRKYGGGWASQFSAIANLPTVPIQPVA